MSPNQRKLVKHIYPLAASGDIAAVKELGRIMRGEAILRYCEYPGCGVPVRSALRTGCRCMTHRKRLASMRKEISIL
jgi:hypothetical protein